jgi:hypothetical protein
MSNAIAGRRLLTAFALSLLAVGCAGGGGGGSSSAAEPAVDPSQALTITIRNQQLAEVRISLFLNGRRERIGDVRPNQTRTFHVPITGTTTVHLEFDISSGPNCVAGNRVVGPGAEIDVTIPRRLTGIFAVCR